MNPTFLDNDTTDALAALAAATAELDQLDQYTTILFPWDFRKPTRRRIPFENGDGEGDGDSLVQRVIHWKFDQEKWSRFLEDLASILSSKVFDDMDVLFGRRTGIQTRPEAGSPSSVTSLLLRFLVCLLQVSSQFHPVTTRHAEEEMVPPFLKSSLLVHFFILTRVHNSSASGEDGEDSALAEQKTAKRCYLVWILVNALFKKVSLNWNQPVLSPAVEELIQIYTALSDVLVWLVTHGSSFLQKEVVSAVVEAGRVIWPHQFALQHICCHGTGILGSRSCDKASFCGDVSSVHR